ncbi:ribbon-helix-helix protein, CopG family [Desulfococcaceae bacterium OttesenSCG-928-F15]|nr:ribbon-helix-helix protein, CopG family [Desulfococcaceae bacterium OttesenSCG-928-F15]
MLTSIQLSEEIIKRLDTLLANTGRSRESVILEAIEAHLENLEDIYEAEQVLERVRRGEERTYSSEEMEQLLDLDMMDFE